MKVLLITVPASSESLSQGSVMMYEPLALEYLGAGVKENHDVKLVDLRPDSNIGIKEVLESYKPDIIGCGGYTVQVNPAREILAEAKKILPEVLTVVGGQHASVMPRDFFDDTIDAVVIGEGVFPFKKICDYHEKQKSFQDIENIYYRNRGTKGDNGQMVFTYKKEHPPLDSLPIPDRSLTAHIRHKYLSYIMIKPMPIAVIRASTGCFYRCKFCSASKVMNHKAYRHSVQRVIQELAPIKEPFMLWVDDEFLLQADEAILLAKEIEKSGIKKDHYYLARVDTIVKNPKCIEEWAKIGLKCVYVGLESFRAKDLKTMKKGTTVSNNEEACRILHENNVQVRGGFIIQPDFDRDDFKALADYARKLKVDIPSFCVLTPFPGTDLYEETKGTFLTDNYNYFDMLHAILPTKIPLKQFYKEYVTFFKRTLTFKQKLMNLKRLMNPEIRRESLKMMQKMKNAYRDYEKNQLN